jgi:cytochrome c
MNSFEINKIVGALLGTCLFLLAVHIASGALFEQVPPAKPGYEVAVNKEQPAAPTGAPAAAAKEPIENLLASASSEHGATIAKQCELCHNVGKGQGNKVGPDLFGVVGRPVASVAGFNYSAPLKAKGGTWTFDALNTWLTDPRADVPGTLMTFAGLPNEKQRADVIAYLNSNSDKPLPLPKVAQNPAGAAPSKGEAANPPANGAAPAAAPAANTPAPPATSPANSAGPTAPPNNPAAAPSSASNPPPANPPATAPSSPPATSAPAAPAGANVPDNAAAPPSTSNPGNAPSSAPVNPPAAAPAAAPSNANEAPPAAAPANPPDNSAAPPPSAPESAAPRHHTKSAKPASHTPARSSVRSKHERRKVRRPAPQYE